MDPKSHGNIAVSFTFLTFLLAISTYSCPARDPFADMKPELNCDLDAPDTQPLSLTEGDIYLDLSTTMRGFLGDEDHQMAVTPFQNLIRSHLLEGLHEVGVHESRQWGFGAEIGELPLPLSRYAQGPRDIYDAGETDIIEVMLRISSTPDSLGVVVTDGAQDLLNAKPGRAPGFDRAAFVHTVRESLVRSGFGVWVVGFMNDFKGDYYSILLTPNTGGARVNEPHSLTKPRPAYCWIFSRDLEQGRRLVGFLHKEVSRRSKRGTEAASSSMVNAIELSPGLFPEIVLEEPFEHEDPFKTNVEGIRKTGEPEGTASWEELRVDAWTPPEGGNKVVGRLRYQRPRGRGFNFLLKARLAHSEDSAPWNSIPDSVWRIHPGTDSRLGADFSDSAKKGADNSMYFLALYDFSRIAGRIPSERISEIPIFVAADLRILGEDHWLRSWSTDDDTTADRVERKTLYLFDVASSLLEKSIGKEQRRGCLHLLFREK